MTDREGRLSVILLIVFSYWLVTCIDWSKVNPL